jgi:hypothetical protein
MDLYRIAKMRVNAFIVSFGKALEEIILDIDDTADETHGGQQLASFHAFYNSTCYLQTISMRDEAGG